MADSIPATDSSERPLPGKGVFGWLGRQFGYLSKAAKHDPAGPQTVYRVSSIEEKPLPEDANVRLRRTTIDEVIVGNPKSEVRNPNQ